MDSSGSSGDESMEEENGSIPGNEISQLCTQDQLAADQESKNIVKVREGKGIQHAIFMTIFSERG